MNPITTRDRSNEISRLGRMVLFNRVVRTDLILAAVILMIFIVPAGGVAAGILEGAGAMTVLFSLGNHVALYKQTKKFY
jgi:hypothetical protein